MAVNVSAHQIAQPDVVEMFPEVLAETGLAPQHLQLEISESVLMRDAAVTVTILEALKTLGFD
jgi:EAL domain-containing protein (putative c-di-GMP-specific phosphodiesterase class I)